MDAREGSDVPDITPELRLQAMALFRQGMKANSVGVHRTLNRPPRGKGWVPGHNMPEGVFCRPEKVRESIEWYHKSYAVLPDIVVLNQIAIGHEMLGDTDEARAAYVLMKEQAEREQNEVYRRGAEMCLARLG